MHVRDLMSCNGALLHCDTSLVNVLCGRELAAAIRGNAAGIGALRCHGDYPAFHQYQVDWDRTPRFVDFWAACGSGVGCLMLPLVTELVIACDVLVVVVVMVVTNVAAVVLIMVLV